MFKGVGVRFADFLIFLKYPMKINRLRPNNITFIEYLKTGWGGGLTLSGFATASYWSYSMG